MSPTEEVLHRLFLVVGSWEVTEVWHMGTALNIQQWPQQGQCVHKGAQAAIGDSVTMPFSMIPLR